MISINVFNWIISLCLPRPSGNLISFMIILRTQGYLAAGKVMRNGIFHITSNTYGKSSQSYEHLYIEFSCVRCCIYHSIQPLRAAHCQRSSRKPLYFSHQPRARLLVCLCLQAQTRYCTLVTKSARSRAHKICGFCRSSAINADDAAVAHSVHIHWYVRFFTRMCDRIWFERAPSTFAVNQHRTIVRQIRAARARDCIDRSIDPVSHVPRILFGGWSSLSCKRTPNRLLIWRLA